MSEKISDLAGLVGGDLSGDGDTLIVSVASPEAAGPDQIAFVADESHLELVSPEAGCLVAPRGMKIDSGRNAIYVDRPKASFARIGAKLHPRKSYKNGIHESAVIAESAKIGHGVFIDAFCFVGEHTEIGEGTQMRAGVKVGDRVSVGTDCMFHANVIIEDDCSIGDRVVLKAGAVIGSKGFGFVRDEDELVPFPQVGTVRIEDDVEIGANSCVDRGALGATVIGQGTKIDNLVQVAHNVNVGKRVVVAALTGISGSVTIGDECVVGGQVGFADHTEIESGAVIGAKSAVFPGKRVKAGVWAGIPVLPIADYKRLNAHIRALPRLRDEVARLSELMARLEKLFKE